MPKLSVVIPCYCSESFIEKTIDDVISILENMDAANFELILVSDASPDSVYRVIEERARSDQRIKGIELSRNFGQHAALLAGYRMASGDFIISMDDDGQTPASGIPSLLEEINKGYDVIYAKYPNIKQTLFRRIGSKVNHIMTEWLLSKPKGITTSSLFVFNRLICDEICKSTTPFPYITGLILRITRRISNVSIEQNIRFAGESGYSFKKLISLWLNGFTSFSVKPLRIATIIGSIVSIFGFVGMLLVFVNKLIHPDTPLGYSSTMMVLLLIGGAIMFMLGMIGEYIGRIFISINNPPQYSIRATTRTHEDSSQFPEGS